MVRRYLAGVHVMSSLTRHPVTDALIDAASRHKAGSWLVPGGPAALAAGLALDHPEATVRWQPVDLREREGIGEAPANLLISEPGMSIPPVEAVAIATVPDRDLVRRWLLVARAALAPAGRLFIAGANSEGIKSVIGDAAKLLGQPVREDYRSKGRLAVFARGDAAGADPAWAGEAGIAPGTWRDFALDVGDASVDLVTQAGVFAGGKVDAGTRLLLDALPAGPAGPVLDVGCGAGVIGIAAAIQGADTVDLADVNLLAVQAAQENIRRLGLARCRAFPGDVYGGCRDIRYDLIVSNPPFHRGKAIDYTVADRLIEGAPVHLRPGGSLLVVANAFLAYGKRMERTFTVVETVAATRQFHVLRASGLR